MHDVVPGEGQEVTGAAFQLTLPPLVTLLVPEAKDVGDVPSREIRNPGSTPQATGSMAGPRRG